MLLAKEVTRDFEDLPYVSELQNWKKAFEFGEVTTGDSAFAPRIQEGIDAARAIGGV